MRNSFSLLGFALIVATTSTGFTAESSLFSNVRTDAVFSPSASEPPAQAKPPAADPILELNTKITNAAQLARIMREAGFEPEEDDENRMVTAETKIDVWTFPVLVMISEDEQQLILVLLLSSVKDEKTIPKSRLLELMEANRRYTPTYFGYSSKHKRTELYHALENRQINGRKLEDQIRRLAEIAKETQKIWDFEGLAESPDNSSNAELDATTPSLVGKWSASRSKTEAFALQFKADNSFLLVYVKNGQQTRSTGKFTADGNNLTLEGKDGFRLAGTITAPSEKQFQFLPENATAGGLTFQRAG